MGTFDERLSIYYNDLDWSIRFKKAGWKTVFYPEAQAVHLHRYTTNLINKDFSLFDEQYDNIFYYFQKHHGKGAVVIYKLLLIIGFLPRSVYWSIRSFFESTEEILRRRQFSVKSLGVAVKESGFRATSRIHQSQF